MIRILGCALSVLLLLPATALAQAAEGNIRGTIRDQQGAVLPGVTITATSAQAPRPTVAVSDGEGIYRLQNLLPGTYTLAADLQGFARHERTGVVMTAGLTLTVDVALSIGTLGETITVVADVPMLDTESSSKTVNISGELQRSLPLTSRKDFSDFLEVTPGVTARGFDQASGGQVYMVRGTDIESHVTLVDGADMGSFRQNWAGLYMGLSTDALEDVQVKTGGADASSPIAMGAITQVATKSGTNQLRGNAGFVFTADNWNGSNAAAGESAATTEVFQPEGALGGPILRDRAWFFGSFRYTRRNVGISRDATQLAALQALRPGFEPFPNQSRSKYYFGKVASQVGRRHQISGFYQYDLNPDETNWAYSADELNVSAFGGRGASTRVTSVWTDRFTTRVMVAYNDKSLNGTLDAFEKYPGTGPAINIYSSTAISGGNPTGQGQIGELDNLFQRAAQPASKLTTSADATFYVSRLAGEHEFQAGVYLQQFDYSSSINYSNGGDALVDGVLRNPTNPAAGYGVFRRRVYDRASVVAVDVDAHDYAFYIQDAWKPTGRLTVNAGLRLDQVTINDNLFGVATMDQWHVGPRLGVNYAITKDHNNIVRASWGRVHDLLNGTLLPTAGSAVAGYTDFYFNPADGTPTNQVTQPAATRVSSDRRIDPDRHQPYINEWMVAYQRQFRGQLAVDVAWVNREYRGRPALLESNGIYDGNVFRGVIDPSQNLVFLNTNNIWNWFVYNGFEVTMSKRTRALQVLGSYARNFQHNDGTWQPNDPASFIQPDAFPNNKGLGTIRGTTGAGQNVSNSLSGTEDIRSPSWQRHVVRLGGTYNAPWRLIFAANYSLQSGPYTGPVVTRLAAADPAFGPATVVKSNGVSMPNPLFTTIRFVGPTRGDAQVEADMLQTLNVRAGRSFQFDGGKVDVAFDIFNALNGDTFQQFKSGGNQTYNPNFGRNADGTMQGQSRQFARAGQLSVRFSF